VNEQTTAIGIYNDTICVTCACLSEIKHWCYKHSFFIRYHY